MDNLWTIVHITVLTFSECRRPPEPLNCAKHKKSQFMMIDLVAWCNRCDRGPSSTGKSHRKSARIISTWNSRESEGESLFRFQFSSLSELDKEGSLRNSEGGDGSWELILLYSHWLSLITMDSHWILLILIDCHWSTLTLVELPLRAHSTEDNQLKRKNWRKRLMRPARSFLRSTSNYPVRLIDRHRR